MSRTLYQSKSHYGQLHKIPRIQQAYVMPGRLLILLSSGLTNQCRHAMRFSRNKFHNFGVRPVAKESRLSFGIFTACGFADMQEWHDDYLTWNPDRYDGVDQLVLHPTQIWLPDIGVLNRSGHSNLITQVTSVFTACHLSWTSISRILR